MPNMDFFRRPLLAGKNTTRMSLASIRGSIRRHDADGTVAFPYFTGAAAAQTLDLKVDEVVFNVTLSGAGINTIIDDINAVLLTAGSAFDSDGTIGIRTITGGPTGSVEVTGGTSSAFLGFDVTNGRIRAVNGDVPSSPEGRVGNWLGVAFPNKGENFTSESVTRALSRIAANADVLYSDDSRSDAVVAKLAFTTGDQRLLTITTTSSRLFTGFGLLSAASTKEDLSPYFQMVDTVTKQVAKSRVVAVARGAVVGLPPYANATTWIGGGAIGNVLGVDLVKVPSVAITDIRNGRIIQSTGADFTDVVPGDFVNITGATNTSQWDNNGYKWVVEEVISTTVLAVRPMSKVELTMMAVTLNNEQPIVELNTAKTGGEVFGNIIVRTGSFCTNVNVIVDPPIPTGATYELWASIGGSVRSNAPSTLRNALSPIYRDNVSDYNLVENGTLSGLVASQAGADCAVTAGLIRLHSKVFSLPARTFVPGFFANGTNYLYWDEATGNFAVTLLTTPWASVLNPAVGTDKGHLVAEVVVAGGVISAVVPITKVRGENSVSVTVGIGGQFATIEAAVLWAQGLVDNYTETTSASGSYPHFEFVVVSDITLGNIITLGTIPSVTIRGANEAVKLTMAAFYFSAGGKRVEIRDLAITTSADSNYFVRVIGAAVTEKVQIQNVRQTAGNVWSIIETTGTGVLNEAQVLDCDFLVSRNVVRGTGSSSRGVDKIRIERSRLVNVVSGVPHIIEHTTLGTAWDGSSLVIKDCDFTGTWGGAVSSGNANPLIVKETGATAGSYILLKNIHIGLGSFVAADNTPLVACVNECLIENVTMTAGKIPLVVAGNASTTVLNSSFLVNTSGATATACTANIIRGCKFSHQDTDADSKAGIILKPSREATFNTLTGPAYRAISTGGASNLLIANNNVQFSPGGSFAEEIQTAIYVVGGGSHIVIKDNILAVSYNSTTGISYCVEFAVTTVNDVTISGNSLGIGRSGILVGGTGTHTDVVITGNTGYVYQDNGDPHVGAAFDVRIFNRCVVTGNDMRLVGTDLTCSFYGVQAGPDVPLEVTGNYFEITGIPFDGGANPSDHWVITGNAFTTATVVAGFSQGLGGIVSGNRFHSLAGTHDVLAIRGVFRGNHVLGDLEIDDFVVNCAISNNYISGNFASPAGSTFSSFQFINNDVVEFFFNTTTIGGGGTGPTWVVGNRIGGELNLTTAGTDAVVNDNIITDHVIVVAGGASVATLQYCDNRNGGNTDLTCNVLKVHNNFVNGIFSITESFNSGHASVVGNTIGSDLNTTVETVEVSGNKIGLDYVHTRTTGTFSKVFFTNNTVGGDFSAQSLDGGSYRIQHMVIQGNFFNATTLAFVALANNLYVCDNTIIPANAVAPTFGGAWVVVKNNTMYSTSLSVGSNQSSLVQVTHTGGGSRVWFENNYLEGRVEMCLSGGMAELWFTGNHVRNLANAWALSLTDIGSRGVISGNTLITDLTNIASGGNSGCISMTASSQHVRIYGNELSVPVLSAAYGGVTTFSVISATSAGFNNEFLFNGNNINKAANATISTFAITLNYINLLNATAIIVDGNLMLSGGTVGAAERQGQLAYHAGAGTYTLAQ